MKKGLWIVSILSFVMIVGIRSANANVTLNVNAKSNTSANKLVYTTGTTTTTTKTVALPWKEKVVYNNGQATATVKTAVQGDLIVKLDYIDYTTKGITTYYFKKITESLPFGEVTYLTLMKAGDTDDDGNTINPDDIKTLYLSKKQPTNTTLTLFDFDTDLNLPAQLIITAVLIDDIELVKPQVIGVDIQTVLFNYQSSTDPKQIWLDLLK